MEIYFRGAKSGELNVHVFPPHAIYRSRLDGREAIKKDGWSKIMNEENADVITPEDRRGLMQSG